MTSDRPGIEKERCAHLVSGGITVVGATESRDTQPIVLDSVAILPDFVRTNDSSESIQLAPPAGDIWTET